MNQRMSRDREREGERGRDRERQGETGRDREREGEGEGESECRLLKSMCVSD